MKWGLFSETGLESIQESNAFINIWEGAVRSSKTICSLVRWIEFVQSGPAGPLLLVGKTERTLKRNILDPLQDILGKRFHANFGRGEVNILGRTAYIVGANDIQAERKIRGMTLAGAYCDEITLYPLEFWNQLMQRNSIDNAQVFGTTNPDSPYHYLKTDFIDKADGDRIRSFHFRLEDNLNLSKRYIENIKALYAGLWYQRFIEGKWVMADGLIYDMFGENNIIGHELAVAITSGWSDWITVDYGTANPCVFMHIKTNGTSAVVLNEYYYDSQLNMRQKTDGEYKDDFRFFIDKNKIGKNLRILIDPSALSFITELRKAGYRIHKADNSVLIGINRVAAMLKQGRLMISDQCKNAVREFGLYSWDKEAQKKGEDKPLKQYDHAMDSLRYFANSFEKGGLKAGKRVT